jgi:hypothetical protein
MYHDVWKVCSSHDQLVSPLNKKNFEVISLIFFLTPLGISRMNTKMTFIDVAGKGEG